MRLARPGLLAAAALGGALALAAGPAAAQNLGERIGAAVSRGAQATGAAADRSLDWARRKVRGENGRGEAKPRRER